MFFYALTAQAVPGSLTYQGRIKNADGLPLEVNGVKFEFAVVNPTGSCILYRETSGSLDMRNSGGVFDVPIGPGTKNYPADPSFKLFDSFTNSTTYSCEGGGTYIPVTDDKRLLRVQFYDGTGWKLISPDSEIRSVPFAGHAKIAQTANSLGNNVASDFVLKSAVPLCVAGQYLRHIAPAGTFECTAPSVAGGNVTGNIAGSSAGFTGNLSGDVSGTQSATSVDKIKGVALDMTGIASGKVLKYNGTSWIPADDTGTVGGITTLNGDVSATGNPAATVTLNDSIVTSAKIVDGTIVDADIASGAIIADSKLATISTAGKVSGSAITSGTIGGSTVVNTTGSVTANSMSTGTLGVNNLQIYKSGNGNKVTITVPALLSPDYALQLPSSAGTAGQVLSTDGSGVLSWISPATGSGGTVKSVTAGTGIVTSPVGGIIDTGSVSVDVGINAGQIVQVAVGNKLPVIDGSNLTALNASQLSSGTLPAGRLPALTGDVVSTAGSNSVTLNTVPISKGGTGATTQTAAINALLPNQGLQAGKFLKTDGTNVAWSVLNISNILSAGSGSWFNAGGLCANGTSLQYNSATDKLECQSYALTSSQVNTALGYTAANGANYVAKAGDTLTGRLGLSSSGFHVATKDDISARTDSGFFESSTPTTAEGWPANAGWYHLLTSTHSNVANYYSMQFAGNFYNSDDLFYRATGGNGAATWNRIWHSGNLTNLNQLTNGPGYITGINSSMVTTALGYTPLGNTSLSGQGIAYNGAGGPQVLGAGGGASMLSFHRPGAYAVNFGLDTDNVLKVGGWSMGGPHTVWHSGNFNPGSKLTLDAWNGSSYIATDGRHYGTIYYDTNNTARYMDPDGHSEINRIRTNSNWDGYQGGVMIHGNAPSITMQDTDTNIRWMFHNEGDSVRIYRANTAGGTDWNQKIMFANDGNIWSSYINDWIFNRIGQDVRNNSSPTFNVLYTNTRVQAGTGNATYPLEVGGQIGFDGQLVSRSSGNAMTFNIQSAWPGGAGWYWRRVNNLNDIAGGGYTNSMVLDPAGMLWTASGYTQPSDSRLKRDIASIPHSLQKVTELEGVYYYWIDPSRGEGQQLGLIAQEVEKVFPQAVHTNEDGYKSISYQILVAPIIGALREIRDWMSGTDGRMTELEAENKMMKEYLCAKDPAAPFCKSH